MAAVEGSDSEDFDIGEGFQPGERKIKWEKTYFAGVSCYPRNVIKTPSYSLYSLQTVCQLTIGV